MPAINRFEDLEVWKQAISLAEVVYRLTASDIFRRDLGLQNQLRRAAVSIGNNIAEGFEYNRSSYFIRYLYIAKASCGEVRSMLLLCQRIGYLSPDQVGPLLAEAMHLSKRLATFIHYLQQIQESKLKAAAKPH